MQRREFITLIGGAAARTRSLAAHAQQSDRVWRIGVLMAHTERDREFQACLAAFREGLKRLGWTEGRNIQIDTRWGALEARKSGNDPRRNSSLSDPTSFLRKTRPRPLHCCNKLTPSLSFLSSLPIRSAAASWGAWRGQAATQLVSPSCWQVSCAAQGDRTARARALPF
jgi:hypothetical protein